MQDPLSQKQLEFLLNANKRWNITHGSVSTGKTIATAHWFMLQIEQCPDSEIAMIGKTATTIYNNVINLYFTEPKLANYKPFLAWHPSRRVLTYKDKVITTYGAKDEGSVGLIQGRTLSLVYCDEMTLYPENFINMLDTRLRKPYSKGVCSMNPTHPSHIVKQWIDKAAQGDPNYYALHFTLEDNPFVDESYKARIKGSLSGVFYKRNYLGLWCMAEGAIFDFFDRDLHVLRKPPTAAEYWVAGIDYGVSNAFACLLIGVATGHNTQSGKRIWVEKEYYWDCKKTGRQKVNSEFAEDVKSFLEPYAIKGIYIDPSALAMKLELQRKGLHVIPADNDVYNGIQTMTSEMAKGNLYVLKDCPNLIREIENYVWDDKKSLMGDDEPVKKGDHAVDALRYVMQTHKVVTYNPYAHSALEYQKNRFQPRGNF